MSGPAGPERLRLLSMIAGRGIEIGAGAVPLPVPPGTEVSYVDAWTPEVLARYHPGEWEADRLVRPAIISRAESLPMFADGSLDFVLTSHVLEHLEDPIAGLAEWHRVLRPGGLLFLCLPDQRATFDAPRSRTTLPHLLADHAEPQDAPGRSARDFEHYVDWARNVNHLEDPRQAEFYARLLQRVGYPIHFHCWIPGDIRELILHLAATGSVPYRILEEVPRADGYEFTFLLAAERR